MFIVLCFVLSECGETCSLFFVLCCMFLSDFICFDGVFGVLFIYCFVWLLCFDVFVVKCVGDDAPIVVKCVRYKYIMLYLLLRLCEVTPFLLIHSCYIFFYDNHSKFIITCIYIQCFIDRLFSL